MITESLKVSSQNQITIPTKVRRSLGIKAGDYVSIVAEGSGVVMYGTGSKWSYAAKGIARGIYKKYGGVSRYLKKERDSWGDG